jgi:DNA polymerase I-like protein with 3'-5' exonuclease and polymerase domains
MQEKSYVLVDTFDKLKDMINHVKDKEVIAFDTETNSLNTRQGTIIGFSVSAEIGKGYYMPTALYDKASNSLVNATIDGKDCQDLAKQFISKLVGKKLVMHNASFDTRFVKNFYGVDLLPSLYVDTILLVHTVNEEGAGFGFASPFGLKSIAQSIQKELGLDVTKEANEEQIELKTSIKENGGSITRENYEIFKADINILAKYAAADTDLTLRVYHHFIKELYDQGLEKFFFEDEVMPLYREVTIPMEEVGVRLDIETMKKAEIDITEEMKKRSHAVVSELLQDSRVKLWILNKAKETYPANSKGAFAQMVVEECQLPLPKSEKTGKYNITKSEVARLPESAAKQFLLNGADVLDEDFSNKISMKMWKEANDGNFFNIQSKDQLGEIAFSVLGFKPLSETKKGKPQFDEDMLQVISETYEWAKNLRIYNKLLKIKSTYIDRFLNASENEIYYFYYKQHGTVSGRYGSDAQQLPRPKEEGDDDPVIIEYTNLVRAFFIPKEGNIFVDCDYESLEPHVFAHVSGDDGLKDIFRNNWDFYSTIAIKTEGLNQYSGDKKADNFLRKHAPKKRNTAKAYALGIPYGMGAYALGKNINVTTKEADKLVKGYLSGFPELDKWMKRSEMEAKTLGYVKTQVGRVRHLPKVKAIYETIGDNLMDWNYKRKLEYEFGKDKVKNLSRDFINGLNNAKNVQIQGLSASIVNRAAMEINREFKKRGINGWVCAQIHDQIVCEVPKEHADEAAKIVQDKMENTTKLSIALKAPPMIAHNLRDGH